MVTTPAITGFSTNSGSTTDTVTNDKTPTLTITADAGSTVEVFQDGVSVRTATEDPNSPGVFTFTSESLADDTYEFTATAGDGITVSQPSDFQTITIDATVAAPGVALTHNTGTSDSNRRT